MPAAAYSVREVIRWAVVPSGQDDTVTDTVDRRAGGLAWLESGVGDVVVFLHGLGGTRTAWPDQLATLSDHRRCVAWDMPGYGDSDPLDEPTFAAIARRLVDLLDLLDAEQADLVGLSFGGMHALHTALDHPERVRRLVLSNTSARFGLDGTSADEWRASRLATLDSGSTLRDLAPTVLDSLVASPLHEARRAALIESFAAVGDVGFRSAVACLPTHDVLDRLGDIARPTLVIGGELDRETPPSYSRAIADGIPDTQLFVLDGVGHLAPSEAPHMFNRLVRDFLDTVPEGDG